MREIPVEELKINPMNLFGKDWGLLAAGNEMNGYNAMTIAWGQLGAVWDRKTASGKSIIPTATVFVRPQRYTKEFIEREKLFTVSFFNPSYKKALGYMGSHSGRAENKVKNAGLTEMFIDNTTAFEEADLVFVCRKIFQTALTEADFLEGEIVAANYPQKDFHEMYIGEIIKVYERK